MTAAWQLDAVTLADRIRAGEISARDAMEQCLSRIETTDTPINAFTSLLFERALRKAALVDRHPARRQLALPGVPFAVGNAFDIAGEPTAAGSRIGLDGAPAWRDAVLVRRLESAGAVLVGALNMNEFGVGFTGENAHYGATRNPRDRARLCGGSAGGAAAAVAAAQVPLALGTDAGGGVRVPASFCGVHGFRPTGGRLPRGGIHLASNGLDEPGLMARSIGDLRIAYDLLKALPCGDAAAPTEAKPAASARGGEPSLRIGVLGGWFIERSSIEARAAVDAIARALGTSRLVEWPDAEGAQAAAALIAHAEAASRHLPALRRHAAGLDPATRRHLMAGAMLPAAWIEDAQRARQVFARQAARTFESVDVLIAAATPCVAPEDGDRDRVRIGASIGTLAEPISAIGLPVVTVPVWTTGTDAPHLPIGVQLIAAPWQELQVLRVAAELEARGVVSAPIAAA